MSSTSDESDPANTAAPGMSTPDRSGDSDGSDGSGRSGGSGDSDQTSGSLPAPTAVPMSALQRGALLRLTEAIRRSSAAERDLVGARDAAIDAAERALAERTETLQSQWEAARRDADTERDDALGRSERSTTTLEAKLQSEYRETVAAVEARATRRREQAEKAYQEAVWLAETVYEATSNQPRELFDQTVKGLDGFANELARVADESAAWLRACRQRPAQVETVDPAVGVPDADAVEVAESAGRMASKNRLDDETDEARRRRDAMRRLKLPRLFRSGLPLVLALLPAALVATGLAFRNGWAFGTEIWIASSATLIATIVVLVVLYFVARAQMHAHHRPLLKSLAAAEAALARCRDEAEHLRDRQLQELLERRDREIAHAKEAHGPVIARIEQSRERRLKEAEERFPREIIDTQTRRELARTEIAERHETTVAAADRARDEGMTAATGEHAQAMKTAHEAFDGKWSDLVAAWRRDTNESWATLEEVRRTVDSHFPSWESDSWTSWQAPNDLPPAIPFGRMRVDLAAIDGGLPEHDALRLPCPPQFDAPAILDFPERASLMLWGDGQESISAALGALQAVMFRLLVSVPPSKARFTIVDPVGLGRNFAGFMHLSDEDGSLVGDRIWTEDRHVDQRLADLTEHMETVIQKYLRNEYATIRQYNVDAGEIAEAYRFLVMANLPAGVTESGAKRLASIAESGARCGVFTLTAFDQRAPRPQGFRPEEIAGAGVALRVRDGRFMWDDEAMAPFLLELDGPPPEALVTAILQKVGQAAKDAKRVEVPFATISPPGPWKGDDEGGRWWTGDCTRELQVALGRTGATKLQELRLGKGVSQHALVAGKTGSGKSTLLHALVTNIAMWYSPQEVELYLIDFKKGVEFSTYATNQLPHARAVAIESDREFGLSVLQRLDGELRRRGELYREVGVQDLPGYRRHAKAKSGAESMPRTVLVIDEFQEFFTEDDRIAQDATLLLDRLVRQGRAFGIHVLLGSQTLGGAYSLARSTIGQMAVRIALQCSEADSYLILSDDNSAARLLARPGEAIYNDAGGLVEGNSPFQVAWLGDDERDDRLRAVAELADRRGARRPEGTIVFEGNVPGQMERNSLLRAALDQPADAPSRTDVPPLAWLGEAIAIKDPTAAVFRRQSGANLLVIGQRDESVIAMFVASTLALLAQRPDSRFVLLDGQPTDAPNAGALGRIAELIPEAVKSFLFRDAGTAIEELHAEMVRRQAEDGTSAAPHFLLVAGLHRFRALRQEDDFGFTPGLDEDATPPPDKLFGQLMREGPSVGIHILASVDTVTNLGRTLDRQSLREFEQRVLFQMGATDSSQMIDSPAASKLGLHRALYASEETGTLEKFRPYGPPDPQWFENAAGRLRTRIGGS